METSIQHMSVKREGEEEGFDDFLQEFLFTTKPEKEDLRLQNESKTRRTEIKQEVCNLKEQNDTGSSPRGNLYK